MTLHTDQIVRRIKAWNSGRPLPLYSTLHTHLASDDDIRVVAFVRMGGESAPWGVVIGTPGRRPVIHTVAEPRNRDLVANMMAEVAPLLVRHFQGPEFSAAPPESIEEALEQPLRQIWMPNPSHVEMLHALAYSYTFTKWGDPTRARKLNALGRLAGWLFRESERAGQMSVLMATEALRSAFTFPSDDLRQAHLGYLLAWLDTRGKRPTRITAAEEAERHSVSTTLDPELERDVLEPIVDKWRDARRSGDDRRMSRQAGKIARVLREELLRRYDLVCQAIDHLRNDRRPVNPGVLALVAESQKEYWYQYLRMERRIHDLEEGPAYIPSPETDRHSAAAATRYFVHAASEEFSSGVLVHHDEELQDQLVAEGRAIRGTIVKVKDEGVGRRTTPVWTLQVTGDPSLRVREGDGLCVAGIAARTVIIRSIERSPSGVLQVEVEITGCKTERSQRYDNLVHAASPALQGVLVTLVPELRDSISRSKSQRVWRGKFAPGSWITFAQATSPKHALPIDVSGNEDSAVAEWRAMS